jgi:uncharacterized membrane protein
MRFWIREIMGWLLVLAGLLLFYICVAILLARGREPLIFEATIINVIGIFVFRGGIHLLKVAVAARVAMQTQTEIARPAVEKQPRKAETPWDW